MSMATDWVYSKRGWDECSGRAGPKARCCMRIRASRVKRCPEPLEKHRKEVGLEAGEFTSEQGKFLDGSKVRAAT